MVDDLGAVPLPSDADATAPAPPSDGVIPPAAEDGSPPATDAERPNPKRDSSVPGEGEDAALFDAFPQVPETSTDDDAKPPDSGGGGSDGASDASTTDDGGTFACGPTKRCNGATEYCRIVPSVVVATVILPLDGGKLGTTYTCVALPPCDATDPCTCLQSGILQSGIVPVGMSCSCSDHGGDITQSCGGGIQPQGN